MRRILAAIDAGELACSAAYRNRPQGAVVALEGVAAGSPATPRVPDSDLLGDDW